MTIHHDKMAYGKLASSREEVSEERLAEMLKQLEEGEDGEEKEDEISTAPQDKRKKYKDKK